MTILHLVRTSAFTDDSLKQCLNLIASADQLFLIDDGVYNIHHSLIQGLKQPVFFLQQHVDARGLIAGSQQRSASYNDLVTATLNAKKVITWQ